MLSSTNKIVVKSRSTDPDPTYIDITWVDDQTFTTTTNVLGLEGYEVEVLQGTGAGYMAHISSIDNNNTYYTVHLDDTFEGVTTGTAKARIQNWEKRATFQNDQVSQYSPFPIEDSSHWLEIKVHFLFTANDEMDDMLVIHKPNQLAN